MIETVSYKHLAPSGDLLACLPGMRQIWIETGKRAVIMQRLNTPASFYEGAIHSIFDEQGDPVAMSKKQWEMLVPLLQAQEYVERCEVWEGQEFEVNLDQIREGKYTPMPNGSLYHWQQLAVPQMAGDYSRPWLLAYYEAVHLEIDAIPKLTFEELNDIYAQTGNLFISRQDQLGWRDCRNKVIVTRTERYTNPMITYFFLSKWISELIFAGTEKEHQKFCADWNLSIPLLYVENFFELALAIKHARFHLTNQTMAYHISEGLGKKRLLEVCPPVANVWPNTPEGYPFMHQVNLEYYFEKFMNQ